MTPAPALLPPDTGTWLTGWLRDALAARGWDVEVDVQEGADMVCPPPVPLVVVRDDSGTRTGLTTFLVQVGISVLAGPRRDASAARALAREVYALATGDAVVCAPGSPVAAVDWGSCRGPYAVPDDQDVSRQYVTAGYRVVGAPA